MKTIEVRRVFERNNCAGKRYIYVTSMEEHDETAASRFRLSTLQMNPDDKIALASVCPMDVVEIVTDVYSPDLLNAGEYIGIVPQFSNMEPRGLCRCGTNLISDGVDVYCPNQECFLTIAARIERLSQTPFFPPDHTKNNIDLPGHNILLTTGFANCYQPFSMITTGEFWNYPGASLEHILQSRTNPLPTLASFLNETLWQDLLNKVGPQDILDSQAYLYIEDFFALMREASARRDPNSSLQNHILSAFLWALGLESVNNFVIEKIMRYERFNGGGINPFLVLAWALTNIPCLINEVGLYRVEAHGIAQEFSRRKYEMFDIFFYLSGGDPDVTKIFGDLR